MKNSIGFIAILYFTFSTSVFAAFEFQSRCFNKQNPVVVDFGDEVKNFSCSIAGEDPRFNEPISLSKVGDGTFNLIYKNQVSVMRQSQTGLVKETVSKTLPKVPDWLSIFKIAAGPNLDSDSHEEEFKFLVEMREDTGKNILVKVSKIEPNDKNEIIGFFICR